MMSYCGNESELEGVGRWRQIKHQDLVGMRGRHESTHCVRVRQEKGALCTIWYISRASLLIKTDRVNGCARKSERHGIHAHNSTMDNRQKESSVDHFEWTWSRLKECHCIERIKKCLVIDKGSSFRGC